MRILQIHNRYRPGWGGEDTVADLEAELLRRYGHQVERISLWTKELDHTSALKLVAAGFGTVWSFRGYRLTSQAIRDFNPDVLHVHNTFPLFSPSVYWAAARTKTPVVQTLHNYRVTCANTLLMRSGRPCQECVGHFPWHALRYRCYGNSLPRTAAVVGKNVFHRWIGTFRKKVHGYIALTEFSKEIFARAGLPEGIITVKSNFSSDPGNVVVPRLPRVVFAGSIARAKGIHLLLDAWTRLPSTVRHELAIVGDGPDRMLLQQQFGTRHDIVWHGHLSRSHVIELIASSRFLALPSLAYENFPMAVLEAFSVGTPVIVPNHGSFAEMVGDGLEGFLFSPGDVPSLTERLQRSLNVEADEWLAYSTRARSTFLSKYSESANYVQLLSVYERAITRSKRRQEQQSPAGYRGVAIEQERLKDCKNR